MIDGILRSQVRERAGDACEYCRIPQAAYPLFSLHIDHVIARQHLEDDSYENLALACPTCNVHKGTNLATVDQDTREIVPLFNPRTDLWNEHFRLINGHVVGLTEVGRATVRLLQMNEAMSVELRGIFGREIS